VVFLGGCNFRCPFCHNHPLVLDPESIPEVPHDTVLDALASTRKWLGGVCVSGGEPTLSPGIGALLKRFKELGLPVKLDTNGSRPEVLADLIGRGLVDMVAMDVKSVLDPAAYRAATGVEADLTAIRRSIDLLKDSGVAHQFRMTVVPTLHDRDTIAAWARMLAGSPLKLQNFNPRTTLSAELSRVKGFTPEEFEDFKRLLN